MSGKPIYSVVVPVYKNAESLPALIRMLTDLRVVVEHRFGVDLEVVFVVDGSPDDSFSVLAKLLPDASFLSQLVVHSRNFGSYAAIRTGLKVGIGRYFGMIAADLQEPPELLVSFLQYLLTNEYDIVLGTRTARDDPSISTLFSRLFWFFYRTIVMPEIPRGGIDLFGCSRMVRDELIANMEANSSLVGFLFWLGFRRKEIPYARQARRHGKSAWTFRKKYKYFVDSTFAFTDLPVRMIISFGALGLAISVFGGLIVFFGKVLGYIETPGYAAIILTIMFFGALNVMGLGVVGGYVWRSYENTKHRPLAVVRELQKFNPAGGQQVDCSENE